MDIYIYMYTGDEILFFFQWGIQAAKRGVSGYDDEGCNLCMPGVCPECLREGWRCDFGTCSLVRLLGVDGRVAMYLGWSQMGGGETLREVLGTNYCRKPLFIFPSEKKHCLPYDVYQLQLHYNADE